MNRAYLRLFLVTGVLSAALFSTAATAQSRVYEKDLAGEWKLIFELDKQADNALERILLNALDGVMDEVDIRFHFEKDHVLNVVVNAMGDEEEAEKSEWMINEKGQLLIGETDHFESDDVWMMKDGRLYAYDVEDGEIAEAEEAVYLEKVR